MAFLTKLDQVADKLRERIIAGEYQRGQKLKQLDIAEELGVSVTPVREALKVLEMEGYIVSQPHKGLCVPEVDYKEVAEHFDLRLMLETDLTFRAVKLMTPENFESLEAAQKAFVKYSLAKDWTAARAANVRFHFRLYEIANRPQTLKFVRLLWAKYPFNYQQQERTGFEPIEHEHSEILALIESGDAKKAAEAMRLHISSGWARITNLLTS